MKGLLKRLAIVILINFSVMTILLLTLRQFKLEVGGDSLGYIVLLLSLVFIGELFWIGLGYKTAKVNYQANVLQENISTEFETLYKALYNNNIQQLEKMRKKVKWTTIVSIICALIAMIGPKPKNDTYMLLIVVLSLFLANFLHIRNRKYIKKYKETYKKEIISTFIKLINNQLDYNPLEAETSIILEDYKKAEFDNIIFNRFYPDDYLEGFVDNEMFIKMCDLHIQHVTGSGDNKNTAEIFQGIFAQTRCGKDIGTYLKVSKNENRIFVKHDKVEMDSEEFEKYFDIYSDNKIVAMQILTSDIMESFIEFYNKYQLEYEIVFRNNTIYMRFFTGPMFEPEIFGKSMDKQLLFIYFTVFKFIIEICKKVNKIIKELEV